MPKFKVLDNVRLSEAGRENDCYASFADKTLTVVSVATKYMPAKEFFEKGKPTGFHPGYDASAGCALYDLADLDGSPIGCSLYEYELIGATTWKSQQSR